MYSKFDIIGESGSQLSAELHQTQQLQFLFIILFGGGEGEKHLWHADITMIYFKMNVVEHAPSFLSK